MGLFEPPTYDERPPRGGFVVDDLPRDKGDGPTWEEKHTASDVTVKTRKRVSALASSFNAVIKAAGVDDACRALDLDPNEIRRLYFVLVEAAQRTEYKAELAGQLPPKVRRFTLPAYVAELYYKRRQLPRDLSEDERRKRIATLARNWRRRLKRLLAVQRHTHLGLLDYEAGEAASNKKVPPAYTDRLTDLLADVSRRASQGRGEPIGRYNRAASDALADFRERFPEFAPEWTPEAEAAGEAPKAPREPKPCDRRKVIAAAARQCVGVVRALIIDEGLSVEEAERLREELHAAIETAWTQGRDRSRRVRTIGGAV